MGEPRSVLMYQDCKKCKAQTKQARILSADTRTEGMYTSWPTVMASKEGTGWVLRPNGLHQINDVLVI